MYNRKRNNSVDRLGTVFIALLYSSTNVLFAQTAESNFWGDRRRAARGEQTAVLASFPVAESRVGIPESSWKNPASLSPVISKSHSGLLGALSPAYGTVRKVSGFPLLSSQPLVIHIQDVHRNREAQWNISEAVSGLVRTGQVDLVALEGATSDLNLQPFVDFPNKKAVQWTADFLLRENMISGPIHATLTLDGRLPRILGVDDPGHYRANVQAYRDSVSLTGATRRILAERASETERLARSVYGPDLLAFDRIVRAYRGQRASLGEYVQTLARSVPSQSLSPSVRRFKEAMEMEKRLDFGAVESERGRLISRLLKKLSPEETSVLMERGVAFRAGRLLTAEFYGGLKETCLHNGIPLAEFPAMDAYVRYVLFTDGIDAGRLLEDLNALEKTAYSGLAKSPKEMELIALSQRQWLAGKLVDFSLTPMEWKAYVAAGGKSLEGFAPGSLATFEAFYKEADARDEAMAANLLKAFDRSLAEGKRSPVAVLVTGGYHASGILEKLNRVGVGVISFVPKIEKMETAQGSAYLSVFTQEKTPLEKLFAGEKLFLASPPFSPAAAQAAVVGVIAAQEALLPIVPSEQEARDSTTLGAERPLTAQDNPGGVEVKGVGPAGTGHVQVNFSLPDDSSKEGIQSMGPMPPQAPSFGFRFLISFVRRPVIRAAQYLTTSFVGLIQSAGEWLKSLSPRRGFDIPQWWTRREFDRHVLTLPLGMTTNFESSPYGSISVLASDPFLYIDPLNLADLTETEKDNFNKDVASRPHTERVDYTVRDRNRGWLKTAFDHFMEKEWNQNTPRAHVFRKYMEDEKEWIADYALFHALLEENKGRAWWDWAPIYRYRDSKALAEYRTTHARDLLFFQYSQWVFEDQWDPVRREAHSRHVTLWGDLAIYPSKNSAEVWARKDIFSLKNNAGAPPDMFDKNGQNWGLPTYQWAANFKGVMAFWELRLRRLKRFFDAGRVDHLLGLAGEWVVPEGQIGSKGWFEPEEPQAMEQLGRTVLGRLVDVALKLNLLLVGEDLGGRPDNVRSMIDQLAAEKSNLLLFHVPGWVDPKIAVLPDYLLIDATHDTPGSFADRLAGLSEGDLRQLAEGVLRVASADGSPELIAEAKTVAQKLGEQAEFQQKDRQWSLTDRVSVSRRTLGILSRGPQRFTTYSLQTLMGWHGEKHQVNFPGTGGPKNWSWRAPVETVDQLETELIVPVPPGKKIGVLAPLFSLPGQDGIGTTSSLGEFVRWVSNLKAAPVSQNRREVLLPPADSWRLDELGGPSVRRVFLGDKLGDLRFNSVARGFDQESKNQFLEFLESYMLNPFIKIEKPQASPSSGFRQLIDILRVEAMRENLATDSWNIFTRKKIALLGEMLVEKISRNEARRLIVPELNYSLLTLTAPYYRAVPDFSVETPGTAMSAKVFNGKEKCVFGQMYDEWIRRCYFDSDFGGDQQTRVQRWNELTQELSSGRTPSSLQGLQNQEIPLRQTLEHRYDGPFQLVLAPGKFEIVLTVYSVEDLPEDLRARAERLDHYQPSYFLVRRTKYGDFITGLKAETVEEKLGLFDGGFATVVEVSAVSENHLTLSVEQGKFTITNQSENGLALRTFLSASGPKKKTMTNDDLERNWMARVFVRTFRLILGIGSKARREKLELNKMADQFHRAMAETAKGNSMAPVVIEVPSVDELNRNPAARMALAAAVVAHSQWVDRGTHRLVLLARPGDSPGGTDWVEATSVGDKTAEVMGHFDRRAAELFTNEVKLGTIVVHLVSSGQLTSQHLFRLAVILRGVLGLDPTENLPVPTVLGEKDHFDAEGLGLVPFIPYLQLATDLRKAMEKMRLFSTAA